MLKDCRETELTDPKFTNISRYLKKSQLTFLQGNYGTQTKLDPCRITVVGESRTAVHRATSGQGRGNITIFMAADVDAEIYYH